MGDGVRVLDVHISWRIQTDGRIIQNRLDAGLDQLIGHFLRGRGWNREHGHLDLFLFDFLDHRGRIQDLIVSDFLPDLSRVVIEYHADMEAAIGEAIVTGQRMTDVAHPDDDHFPDAIHFQDVAQAFGQKGNRISGSLFAEFTELRNVLADLRRRDADDLAQFLRRCGLNPFSDNRCNARK